MGVWLGRLRSAVRWAVLGVSAAVVSLGPLVADPSNAQRRYSGGVPSGTPAIQVGSARLVSPTAANTYYGTATTSSNSLVQNPLGSPGQEGLGDPVILNEPYAAEIIAAAAGVDNNPVEIFRFVRDTVETTFTYGVSKGALGAMIDRSGTPFDQAQLLVEMLRASGKATAVGYREGQITLTGAEFMAWTGVGDSARAACQLLAHGGIPAIVNGQSDLDCSASAFNGTLTQVQMQHVWVAATFNGTAYLLDPSRKTYTVNNGVNLNTAAGLTTGQALTQASGSVQTGTASGVGYVRDVNDGALDTFIQARAAQLQTYIDNRLADTNLDNDGMDDLVGGREIVPWNSTLTTSLAGYALEQSWSGDIPNQYRATLGVTISKYLEAGGTTNIAVHTFYADDIYGRRLVFQTNFDNHRSPTGGTTFWGELRVVNRLGEGVAVTRFTNSDVVRTSYGDITLAVNMPYVAAPAAATTQCTSGNARVFSDQSAPPNPCGGYMDGTSTKQVSYGLPFTIANGWGLTDRSMIDFWGSRADTPMPIPPTNCENCWDITMRGTAGDGRREQMAVSWLAQASRAGALHAEIANAEFQHHYSVGIVSADSIIEVVDTGLDPSPPDDWYYYTLSDSFDRIDIDSGISVVSRTADATARRAVVHSLGATLNALEGSVVAQFTDLPDITSTATRFAWGNSPPSGEDQSGGAGPRRFYAFNSTNQASAGSLVKVEGQTSTSADGVHSYFGEPEIGSSELNRRRDRYAFAIQEYANAGYSVIASEDAFLGPGQRGGSYQPYQTGCFPVIGCTPTSYVHNPSYQRGGALVATQYDANGDPVRIAHVTVGEEGRSKGGGGGAQVYHAAQYDPSTAADVLQASFQDRSAAAGIDLASGNVQYASPAALQVGQGAFPYSLSAQLSWMGRPQNPNGSGPEDVSSWQTNWANSLSISSSTLDTMGDTDIRAVAGTVAAFMVMQDLYAQTPSTTRDVAGVLTAAWWMNHTRGNVVSVSLGGDGQQFLRRVDGTWFLPGAGPYATLTQTGSRSVVAERPACSDSAYAADYVPTRGWSYQGMSFQVTRANGDIQHFNSWRVDAGTSTGGAACRREQGFRLDQWVFPQGVTVELEYDQSDFNFSRLAEVSNNLGRRIVFIEGGQQGFNNGLTGGDLRQVSVAGDVHTDAAGAQTRFAFQSLGRRFPQAVLTEVFSADDPLTPSLRYRYNAMAQVVEADDAAAVRGLRGPHRFARTPRYRGRRTEPTLTQTSGVWNAGPAYTVNYDRHGRGVRFTDELGRVTTAEYDDRGRPKAYVYPEGNRQEFRYDDRNNIRWMRRAARPDDPTTTGVNESQCTTAAVMATNPVRLPSEFVRAGCSDLIIEASWNTAFNKPDWIRDTGPDGQVRETNFTYYTSGNGRGLIHTAIRPDPDTTDSNPNRPTYTFAYNSFGQPTSIIDAAAVETRHVYHSTNRYLIRTETGWSSLGVQQHFVNDALGQVVQTYDNRGSTTSVYFEYDAAGRVTRETRPHGTETRTTYDAVGRPILVRQRLLQGSTETWAETRTGYTPTGQVWWVEEPSGVPNQAGDTTITTYDAMDRRLSVTDPEGVATVFTYDAAGQLLTETRGVINGAGGELFARFGYTLNGQQAWIRDGRRDQSFIPGTHNPLDPIRNTATMQYDGHGRLVRTTFPDGSAPRYSFEELVYDPAGLPTLRRTREGLIVRTAYDRLDRRVSEEDWWTDNTTTGRAGQWWRAYPATFQYDLAGRMTQARTFDRADAQAPALQPAVATRSYTYDLAGRPATSSHSHSGTFTFGYDVAGNLTSLNHGDGVIATYGWDLQSRMTSASLSDSGTAAGSATLTYDTLGRRTLVTFGDSSTQAYAWEIDGDLASISHVYPNRTSDNAVFTYGHDRVGRVTTEQINHAAYNYEAQVATVAYGAATAINTYPTVGANTLGYLDASSQGLGLHSAGNLHTDGSGWWRYYNTNGQLIHATSGAAWQIYLYDALGERYQTQRQDDANNQRLFYTVSDGLRPETVREVDYAWSTSQPSWTQNGSRAYVLGPLPDERLIWMEGRGSGRVVSYPHTDRRGSTIAMSRAGQAVNTYGYDEFGRGRAGDGVTGYPFRYTGQRLDPWTGTYHYKAREYSPNLGRFLQPDPARFVDGPNMYAYVGNSPWNLIDPTGKQQCRSGPCPPPITEAMAAVDRAVGGADSELAASRLRENRPYYDQSHVFIRVADIDTRGTSYLLENGEVEVTISAALVAAASDPGPMGDIARVQLAAALPHEGPGHGEYSEENGNPASYDGFYDSEYRAQEYTADVYIGLQNIGEGAGIPDSYPRSGSSPEERHRLIDAQASESARESCEDWGHC